MRMLMAICALLASLAIPAKAVEVLAYYDVRPAAQPPSIDGKLDDPCWVSAGTASVYYKYNNPTPVKGSIDTSFKMLYDAKGVYLGITNYDKNPDKLKAKATTRDDDNLWHDDCAEIYFDPYCSGIGFVKFAVNSIGIQWDMKRVDAAIELPNWSGGGWRAKTAKSADAWTIEAFFPWADLGKEAKEGDLWRFDHVRYAWPNNQFVGVTWSLGGGYNSPGKFGFIRFAGNSSCDPAAVLELLARHAAPPWLALLEGKIAVNDGVGKPLLQTPEEFVSKEKARFEAGMAKLESVGVLKAPESWADPAMGPTKVELESYLAGCKTAAAANPDSPLAALEQGGQFQSLSRLGERILWSVKVRELVDQYASKGKGL